MTRSTCWDAQRRIFQYINDCGLLLNNEHPKDWAAPYFYMARTRQQREGVYGYEQTTIDRADLPGTSVFARNETGEVFHVYSGYTNGGDMPLAANYPELLRGL